MHFQKKGGLTMRCAGAGRSQRLVAAYFGRSGFSVLELLTVIGIIGLLLALIVPAVQSSREAARRTQCKNNIRQLALAMENHQSVYGRFPTNGWGYRWIGVPDRGTDKRQPGGWIYNVLPYLERNGLREMGRGEPLPEQWSSLSRLMQSRLPGLSCPSRPAGVLSPQNTGVRPYNADWVPMVAKTDYAVNEGDHITDTRAGPSTLQEGDSGAYVWRDPSAATGICFQRSQIRPGDIRDGLSQTYLLGEKHVSITGYDSHDDPGHDQSMYCGVDLDINRWVINPPARDSDAIHERRFGSAHLTGCHMALCDGSVRLISYSIDGEIHRRVGNRRDGLVVTLP